MAPNVQSQFWSIERVIAFVVAPVATPLSGALALWLGKHFPGVNVSGPAIYAFAATTAAGVAGSFIKWLDGRQKFVASLGHLETDVTHALGPVEALIPADERSKLLAGVEKIVEGKLSELRLSLAHNVATLVDQPVEESGHRVGEPEPAASASAIGAHLPGESPEPPAAAPAETPAPPHTQ